MTSKPVNKVFEPSKADLIRALVTLEGELQARDIVISILKTESVRRLIHPCYNKRRWIQSQTHSNKLSTDTIIPNNRALKCKQLQQQQNINHQDSTASLQDQQQQPQQHSSPQQQSIFKTVQMKIAPSDPYTALLRDTYSAYDPTYDENSIKLIFNLEYHNLRNLIDHQRRVRKFLESQVADWEAKYKACWQELESETIKSSKYERDKMVTRIEQLEKENETLKREMETTKSEMDLEKEREKSMIMFLVTERKELICRLIEHEQHNNVLIDMLAAEQCRSAEMSEDLEEESKRSLQMESELERMAASYEKSKALLLDKINTLENKSTKLEEENAQLKRELEAVKSKKLSQLGEGVRSTIVTINSTDHKVVPSVTSSVAASNQPKMNVARPVSPSRVISTTGSLSSSSSSGQAAIVSASASVSSPRSTVAGQVSTVSSSSTVSILASTLPTTTTTISSSYAATQPISKSGTNHANAPLNSITSTPSTSTSMSKTSSSGSLAAVAAAQTAPAFQNMTYNMENTTPPLKPSNVTPQSSNILTTIASSSSSSSAATTTTSRTVTPGKVMIASGSPQAPVQKKLSSGPLTGTGSGTSPVFRGAPPPIPPNKPILPANALKERSKEIQQATVRAKMMTTTTTKPINSSSSLSTASSSTTSVPVPVQGEPIVNDKSPSASSSTSLSPSVVVNGTIKRKDKIKLITAINSSSSSSSSAATPNQVPKKNVNLMNSETKNKVIIGTITTTNSDDDTKKNLNNNSEAKQSVDSNQMMNQDETSTHVELISKEIADFQKLLGSMVAKTLKDKQLF